jgi:hypothetical protein
MSCGDGALKTRRRKKRAVGLSGDRNSADPNGRFNSAIYRVEWSLLQKMWFTCIGLATDRQLQSTSTRKTAKLFNMLFSKGWPFRKWETFNAIDLRYKLSVLCLCHL